VVHKVFKDHKEIKAQLVTKELLVTRVIKVTRVTKVHLDQQEIKEIPVTKVQLAIKEL